MKPEGMTGYIKNKTLRYNLSVLFNQSCFFERFEGTVLFDVFDGLGRDLHNKSLVQLWNIDSFLLKIRKSSSFSSRVKLSRTSAVAVATTYLRTFFSYWAYS